MKLIGPEKGMLINFALQLAIKNTPEETKINCDILMQQLKIACDFKKKAELFIDSEFQDKKSIELKIQKIEHKSDLVDL